MSKKYKYGSYDYEKHKKFIKIMSQINKMGRLAHAGEPRFRRVSSNSGYYK